MSGNLTFVKGGVSEQTFTVSTFDNNERDVDKTVILRLLDHVDVPLGFTKPGEPQRHVEDVDGDGDIDLVFHSRYDETCLPCDPEVVPFNGWTFDGQPITARGGNGCWSKSSGRDDPGWDTLAGQWLMAKDALFDFPGCLGYPMREWT